MLSILLNFFCSELLLLQFGEQKRGGSRKEASQAPRKVYKSSLLRGVTTLGVYDYVLAWLFLSTQYHSNTPILLLCTLVYNAMPSQLHEPKMKMSCSLSIGPKKLGRICWFIHKPHPSINQYSYQDSYVVIKNSNSYHRYIFATAYFCIMKLKN